MTVLAASPSVFDQPGTVAFLVIFGMGVILFFVFRSMSKHLRKIAMAARAEEEAAARAAAGEGEADGAGPVIAGDAAPASPASGRRPAR
ncbi:MAG TPA: hypothetical protein VF834_09180 [Streptosporangiaceae bacterium]